MRKKNWWIGFAVEENFGYDNPDICEKIDEEGENVLWRMDCKYANWSNNPFLCSKEWFLELAVKIGFTEMGKSTKQLEVQILKNQVEANDVVATTRL